MMQRTVNGTVTIAGATLWSKGCCEVTVKPGKPDSGILMRRTDLKPGVTFKASVENASVSDHRVVLHGSGKKLAFVEHLLAALWGLGVDNAEVDVAGSELPFFDGSALPYVESILKAGLRNQSSPRKVLNLRRTYMFMARGRLMYLYPAPRLTIGYLFFYQGLKALRINEVEAEFARRIAPARTFTYGNYPRFDYPFQIRASRGLVGRKTLLYPYPARFPDEMIRHKLLDLIGDLALLGVRPAACVWAAGTGHRETHIAVKTLTKENRYEGLEYRLDPLQAPSPISFPDD